MSFLPDPSDEERPAEVESLPDEENISPGQVEEQLETEPEEARNYTDGYAPEDEDFDPIEDDEFED